MEEYNIEIITQEWYYSTRLLSVLLEHRDLLSFKPGLISSPYSLTAIKSKSYDSLSTVR